MVGLPLSHPYTFASILKDRDIEISHVWDYEHPKADEFARRYGVTQVTDCIETIADAGVDGVMVCVKNSEHAKYALPFIAAGVPTYINKPMVTNRADLDRLLESIEEHKTPVMSCSSIRYAPPMVKAREFVQAGKPGTLLGGHAVAMHSIEVYMKQPHKWQDDPETGGGSIINMGVHAVEPLVAALGAGAESVWCTASKRFYTKSLSEDTAAISLRYADGRAATVDVICGTTAHGYELTIFGSEASISASLPGADVRSFAGGGIGEADARVTNGYVGLMDDFLRMCDTGEMPIALSETREIMLVLLAARESAESGAAVRIG